MSRSRSASATTSLPKPAALVPDGIGRSTAAVSSLLTSISRVSGGSTSRVDMGYFQMTDDGRQTTDCRVGKGGRGVVVLARSSLRLCPRGPSAQLRGRTAWAKAPATDAPCHRLYQAPLPTLQSVLRHPTRSGALTQPGQDLETRIAVGGSPARFCGAQGPGPGASRPPTRFGPKSHRLHP